MNTNSFNNQCCKTLMIKTNWITCHGSSSWKWWIIFSFLIRTLQQNKNQEDFIAVQKLSEIFRFCTWFPRACYPKWTELRRIPASELLSGILRVVACFGPGALPQVESSNASSHKMMLSSANGAARLPCVCHIHLNLFLTTRPRCRPDLAMCKERRKLFRMNVCFLTSFLKCEKMGWGGVEDYKSGS